MILLMKKLIKKATHKFGSFLCLDFFKPHTQGETAYVDVNVRIRPVWCAIRDSPPLRLKARVGPSRRPHSGRLRTSAIRQSTGLSR